MNTPDGVITLVRRYNLCSGNIIRGIDGISQTDVWAISEAGDLSNIFIISMALNGQQIGINRSIA